MYVKILFAIIVIILGGFFYLHYINPGEVAFLLSRNLSYTLPVTLLIFIGFIGGVVLAVVNSLIVDTKRALKHARERKKLKGDAQRDREYHKGLEALVSGDTRTARTLIEKAMKGRAGDAALVINLSDTYTAEARPDEAVRVIEEGLSANPGSVALHAALGSAALAAGDDLKARRALEEVLKAEPKSRTALKDLRDLFIREGDNVSASDLQKRYVETLSEGEARDREKKTLSGLIYRAVMGEAESGNLEEAEKRINDLIKKDGAFLPAHVARGDILLGKGHIHKALDAWEGSLRSMPKSAPLLLRFEDACIRDSNPERVLDMYRVLVDREPADTKMRLLLARLYLRLEMVDNAIEELEGLHGEGSETPYSKTLLGAAYLRRDQSERASMLFEEALGFTEEMPPPFECSACSRPAPGWAERCGECGEWDTLSMMA